MSIRRLSSYIYRRNPRKIFYYDNCRKQIDVGNYRVYDLDILHYIHILSTEQKSYESWHENSDFNNRK